MNLQESCSVCRRNNHNGFWWRVFTPEYSRNIWCKLAVIVGFRQTTVCLVKGEQRPLKQEMFKRRFLLCATILKSRLGMKKWMENVFYPFIMRQWQHISMLSHHVYSTRVFCYTVSELVRAEPAALVALQCLWGFQKHVWALLYITHSWPHGAEVYASSNCQSLCILRTAPLFPPSHLCIHTAKCPRKVILSKKDKVTPN